MSSSAEDSHSDQDHPTIIPGIKKRRVQRACDICRRKKGDGGQMPNNRCSNCITYNHECTYVEAAKKRGPPKGYVEGLESRVVTMEKLLVKLCPDRDVLSELGGPFDKDAWLAKGGVKGASVMPTPSTSENRHPHPIPPPLTPHDDEELGPSDNEITARRTLEMGMKNLRINAGHPRFFGKSSSVMFLQTAIMLRHEYTGAEMARLGPEGKKDILPCKRPEFWRAHPKPHESFPPPDLLASLVDLYFNKCNLYLPLLHRPTFEQSIADNLHLQDEGFGLVLLLVCALGARFSDDPRVILQGSNSQHSAGWEWFRQVQWIRRSLLSPPRLYDLQVACLTAVFLHGSATPQASWTVIGVGIRMAQDVGAHRKKTYTSKKTVEEELWKRAFWCLLTYDRFISSALGRPCAIHDEDFDVDLPVECDDEYWETEDPNKAFKQPAGKPSKIAYFNCLIRQNQILAFALRTIYSINKSKVLLGFIGPRWEQHIVSELDSALNKWIDAVPDHLRWDPNREDPVFLAQSAALYALYYNLQIIVHRPFISSPRKPSSLVFPSLAICTNAARSCIHVLDVNYRRNGSASFSNIMSLFLAGIILLLNIWGGKRAGSVITDPAKEMADVHKAMKMLKALERRWHTAGRLWDIMYELAEVGDLPLPQPSPQPSNKRDRNSENKLVNSSGPESSPSPASEPRHFAGSRRVGEAKARQTSRSNSSLSPTPQVHQVMDTPPPPSLPQASMYSASSSIIDTTPVPVPQHAQPITLPVNGFSMGNASYGAGPSTSHGQMNNPQLQTGQPLDMDPILSMQSMMYDQALANLSASLMPQAGPTAQQQQTSQTSGPQFVHPPDENLDEWLRMASLGAGAFSPDATAETASQSMWSAAPNGFEWDDWGAYISNFGGMNMGYPQGGPSGQSTPFGQPPN
ncbi:fungal-specific transcription factor domain-containing protein [Irpex lacteus]|nr:fungal-specific transcription factor domain-containing protein [Irpex lacteus]